jgi:hypothetical protein
LCYADLRPPPPPEPEPAPAPPPVLPAAGPPGTDPLTDPLSDPLSDPPEAVTGPSWPCSACGTVNPMAHDTCSACGQHFLAGVRGQEAPLLDLPVVGDITQLGRAQRIGLAVLVVVAAIVLTFLLGLIFS